MDPGQLTIWRLSVVKLGQINKQNECFILFFLCVFYRQMAEFELREVRVWLTFDLQVWVILVSQCTNMTLGHKTDLEKLNLAWFPQREESNSAVQLDLEKSGNASEMANCPSRLLQVSVETRTDADFSKSVHSAWFTAYDIEYTQ